MTRDQAPLVAGAEPALMAGYDRGVPSRGTLMVGLPRTGKTSYLGLLFVAMVKRGSSEDLVLEEYNQDHSYLNLIAERLMGFQSADHTETDQRDGLDLTVRLPDARPMKLYVPDLSGETWQAAHIERVLSAEVADRAAEVDGFVLFAHVGEFVPSTTIVEDMAAAIDLGMGEDEWQESASPVEVSGESPTQVALVDLIQMMREWQQKPFRLSLVLSAYDIAQAVPAPLSPHEWVETNMPLLDQFLTANADRIACRTFGVSAQGGVYSSADGQEGAPSTGAPMLDGGLLERAYVLGEDGTRTAISHPLLWALGDV